VTWLLIVGLFFFIALGIPVAFAMLLTSLVYIVLHPTIPLIVMAQQVSVGTDKYLLLSIPFFFLAAELMSAGGILRQMVRFATAVVGPIRGGLGHMNVVANMIMAGMSGSAVADAAGLGKLAVQLMREGGYSVGFAGAITAAASTIGPIIPPSIPFVIYGGIAGVSVGRLFLGGVLPGLLMGGFLMGAVWWIAQRRGYRKEKPIRPRELVIEAWRSLPVLVLPVIILGGILSGAFTPTESSVVAVVYAFLIGTFLLRALRPGAVGAALVRVGVETSRVMLIIASGTLFAWILAREGVPQELARGFLSISREPWILLLLVNALLLVLGFVMEPISIMVVLVPVFSPLIHAAGIDPVHFGVVMTLTLMLGLIHPPVGIVMFVIMSITGISVEEFTREVWPFLLALFLVLFLITVFPPLVLFIPDLMMGARS
jgi:tripartite ATP-independent transporter DctM subunit